MPRATNLLALVEAVNSPPLTVTITAIQEAASLSGLVNPVDNQLALARLAHFANPFDVTVLKPSRGRLMYLVRAASCERKGMYERSAAAQ